MYQANSHHFGSVIIRQGPMSGCRGFEEHEWRGVGAFRKKQDAINAAVACPIRCVVIKAGTSDILFDNGKSSGERE